MTIQPQYDPVTISHSKLLMWKTHFYPEVIFSPYSSLLSHVSLNLANNSLIPGPEIVYGLPYF